MRNVPRKKCEGVNPLDLRVHTLYFATNARTRVNPGLELLSNKVQAIRSI